MEHKNITVSSEAGNVQVEVSSYPDTCPICHQGVDIRFRSGYIFSDEYRLQLIFQCPRKECRNLFIGYYSLPTYNRSAPYYCDKCEPLRYSEQSFSSNISEVSSEFVNIYNQTAQAETLQLNTIVGPGYRKALEYLIKDYVILKKKVEKTIIQEMALSTVINNYTDGKLKSTAKRAAWLGNDNTHYYKKWEDKDIEDLKILVKLTLIWIESEELTSHYENEMKD